MYFQTSIYSSDSTDNLSESKADNNKKTVLSPSTTPLEPDKTWKSIETVSKSKETNEIDKEFDMFTKERVEIKKTENVTIKNNLNNESLLNSHKNNLGTVEEDEEKHDINASISETASSITQFCQTVIKKTGDNDLKDNENKDDNPLESSQNKKTKEVSKMNFEEIQIKQKNVNELKRNSLPENKPFLRDRAASIGTLNLKTPIAQLIGEQNRTMLFQVNNSSHYTIGHSSVALKSIVISIINRLCK